MVKDANDCTTNGDYVALTFEENPIAGFEFETEDATGVVEFTNNSENANNYLWNFGNGIGTSTDENPIYTYLEGGSYYVTLMASSENCSNDIIRIISVDDIISTTTLKFGSIEVYPNTSNGIFTIVADKEYELIIVDITGKTILNKMITDSENEIDISNNVSGIYFAILRTGNKLTTFKIIKE